MPAFKPISIGQRFGRLTVISGPHREGKRVKYECQCDCGKISHPRSDSLLKGESFSCGCLRRERFNNNSHGESYEKLYRVWAQMIQRCTNPKHASYCYY